MSYVTQTFEYIWITLFEYMSCIGHTFEYVFNICLPLNHGWEIYLTQGFSKTEDV